MTHLPPLHAPSDVLAAERFAELALRAASSTGAALVLTALDDRGVSTGDLVVVENLPAAPADRARILSETTLFLYGASAAPLAFLAYAIVEPDGQRHVAFAAIIRPPISSCTKSSGKTPSHRSAEAAKSRHTGPRLEYWRAYSHRQANRPRLYLFPRGRSGTLPCAETTASLPLCPGGATWSGWRPSRHEHESGAPPDISRC